MAQAVTLIRQICRMVSLQRPGRRVIYYNGLLYVFPTCNIVNVLTNFIFLPQHTFLRHDLAYFVLKVPLNTNNNNQGDVYSAIISCKAIARVHSGHLNECGLAPGGRQRIRKAANRVFDVTSWWSGEKDDVHMLKTVQNAAALRISYHTKLTKACVISSTVGGFRLRLAPDLLTWSSLLWHSVANSLSFVYSIRREHEQLWTQFTRHVNKTDWSTNNKTQNKLN